MRIVGLQVENYKRIRLVEITPKGALIDVAGKNESGKTSLGDAIWAALEYAKHVQKTPIRKGQKKARIEIKLGNGETVDYIVRRTFNAQEEGRFTTSVVIEKVIEEGVKARLEEPQRILSNFIGALAFDPLAFMVMKPQEQFDALTQFVPGVDFKALAAADEADREARLLAGREAKALRARVDAIIVPADAPLVAENERALLDELTAASTHNEEVERERSARLSAIAALDRSVTALATMQDRRRSMALDLQKLDEDIETLQANIAIDREGLNKPALAEKIDTAALRERIDTARAHNERVVEASRLRAESDRIGTEANVADAKVAGLTRVIEARERNRREAIAKAKMPVEGITFGNGIVLYNDLPLDQASSAKQVILCTAIAAAMNPKLPVIWIKNGNDLDDDNLAALGKFAEEKGLQIFVERVGDTSAAGVIMEDGHLVGVTMPAETEEKANG